MRSMKLLVAMAVLAAFVSGPVLAQSSTSPSTGSDSSMSSGSMSSDSMSKTTTGTKGKKHTGKHKKKKSTSGAASSTTTGQ
jgi:hypothetical protein